MNRLMFLLILLTTSCKNENSNPVTAIELNAAHRIDADIKQWQQELKLPNVGLGIIENGKITMIKVYGKTATAKNAPIDMLFNVASVTKVIFTELVLKPIANGDWNLDKPLYQYHIDPDVAADDRHKRITTRHILSQQSGFVNWRWNHPTEKLTFDFEPGTTYNYSGEGMEYLRKAIEIKFNKSLSHLSDSLLFEPLTMDKTTHSWDGKSDYDKFSLAYDSDGQLHDIKDHSTIDNAADDLITTVLDLAKFGQYVMRDQSVSETLFNERKKSQVEINPNMSQGLGWRVINNLSNGEYAIQHGGNDIGVASLIVLLPKSKNGLVILTNGDSGLFMCNNIVRKLWSTIGTEIIHRSYRSKRIEDSPKPIDMSTEKLALLEGQYVQPSGRELSISINKNGLLLKMPGTPNLELLPETNDTFFLLDFDPKIVFTKNKDGIIDAALIVEGENVIRCEKIKNTK